MYFFFSFSQFFLSMLFNQRLCKPTLRLCRTEHVCCCSIACHCGCACCDDCQQRCRRLACRSVAFNDAAIFRFVAYKIRLSTLFHHQQYARVCVCVFVWATADTDNYITLLMPFECTHTHTHFSNGTKRTRNGRWSIHLRFQFLCVMLCTSALLGCVSMSLCWLSIQIFRRR